MYNIAVESTPPDQIITLRLCDIGFLPLLGILFLPEN
jgi:hypothetical protein